MGGKGSKSNGKPNETKAVPQITRDSVEKRKEKMQFQHQLDVQLDSKRPTSRRITDQWSVVNLPAYALQTLDENTVVLHRHTTSEDEILPRLSVADSVDSGGEALVYVFNPDRVASRRVSKRMSAADSELIFERMSHRSTNFSELSFERKSNMSEIPPVKNAFDGNFSMVSC